MTLAPDLIERIREATDIAAVIGEHVNLKRSGRTFKGLCPFHKEKTPSFIVNPDRQIFKCFGCGEGGDIYRFLMDFDKLSFPEAVQSLADRAGIIVPKSKWDGPQEESVYPVLAWAENHYQELLAGPGGAGATRYLKERGISDYVREKYGLGWVPDRWDTLLQAMGRRTTQAMLSRAGLVTKKDGGGYYDRFRGRVMIPIRSALGKTIGFGGRTIDGGEPKYLNSPETETFIKGKVLYGLSEAREALKEHGFAIVVEGYLDVFALVQGGFQNTIATCGTAFTVDQARVLKRYVDKVIIAFDGDKAGVRAAWKSAGIFLGEGLDVRILNLPAEDDPDSYIRREGPEAMSEKLSQSPTVVGFARDVLLGQLERREDLLKAFAYLGAKIEDPIRRRVLLQEAAESFRFNESVLVGESNRQRKPQATQRKMRPETQDRVGRLYLGRLIEGIEGFSEDLLVPEEAIMESELRHLYATWLSLWQSGDPDPKHTLLNDDANRSLTSALLAGDLPETDQMEQVTKRLRDRVVQAEGKKIQHAIRQAETRGDDAEVIRLSRELQSLRGGTGIPDQPQG
ncbi:MAG: DNA primase [Candidatus Eisenbacteria bacterium]|uniref:DNA primase n=1 Tax=Eiseniibacteriota bacterium TaxID=2212470 RepID=A0A7Y2EBF9_UNCEI|nr:DNA primase [Candidatus Eisenbacteria bacterium]